MAFYTYLMASRPYGTLYCGHTESMPRRSWEHREKVRPGFTAKYDVVRLVWYEVHDTREGAKLRERQIKKWNRAWKIRLILEMNPEWNDLYWDFHDRPDQPLPDWIIKSDCPREGGGPTD